MLPSNKTILRTIEKFIGDIRWRPAVIDGVRITEVRPDGLTIIRNGIAEIFSRGIELNVLKNYEHQGYAFQYPINATIPPDSPFDQSQE